MPLPLSALDDLRVGWRKIVAQKQYANLKIHVFLWKGELYAYSNSEQAPPGAELLEIIQSDNVAAPRNELELAHDAGRYLSRDGLDHSP
jgi:hypothetical protein